MSRAPAALLEARALLLAHLDVHPGQAVAADLDPAEVGIVADTAHQGGYHCGSDRTIPGDYSVIESPRDRAGLDDYASALDVGEFVVTVAGRRWTLREFSLWLVDLCQRGDPDTADIREVIYSPDGARVARWDRLRRRTTGDSSHRTHTHISVHRDASGESVVRLVRRWLIHIGLEGEDMATAREVWEYTVGSPSLGDRSAGEWLKRGEVAARIASSAVNEVAALSGRVDALITALSANPGGGGVDLAEVEAAAERGVSRVLSAAARAAAAEAADQT